MGSRAFFFVATFLSLFVALIGSVADLPMVVSPVAAAQQANADDSESVDVDLGDGAKAGFLIEVPVPLTSDLSRKLLAQLNGLAKSAPANARVQVALRYLPDSSGGEATAFEDALRIARAMTGQELRSLRVISMVEGDVTGHSVLPILASDALVLTQTGSLGDASAGESTPDETVLLNYKSIASRRGLFPPAIVESLVDPESELAWVTKVDGTKVFSSGEQLVKLRETGDVIGEDVWSAPGAPAKLTADQLRDARIAAAVVTSVQDTAEVFDLAKLIPIETSADSGERKGVLLEVTGSVSRSRVKRWQSNLNATLSDETINTWMVTFDSIGGDIDQSAGLSGSMAAPSPPISTIAGFISVEARADSALVAMACKPLVMAPASTLGGTGADEITLADLDNHAELIELVAKNTKRSPGLIRGLLCPELQVFRYTNKKTGLVRYTTDEDLVAGVDNQAIEKERWEKGDRIELADGLPAAKAIELGLADAQSDTLETACQSVGLKAIPPPVADRGLVRFVERLGRSRGLMMILLLVGFMALSAEMNAPGISVPGFFAVVCFGLFFWMNYLAGTAEWLELVLLILGLGCIALEIFVIPGFGVFGIGGLIMTIAAIVLMSQTFVLPQNSYQLTVVTKGLWGAIGSLLGLFGGFVLMRQLFPHVPLFKHLVMEAPDAVAIEEAEKLADFSGLLHQSGITTTPLRPSGKARFGDDTLQVVSDGSMIEKGVSVTVIEVQGVKIVVEE